jgi:hypothetical protein
MIKMSLDIDAALKAALDAAKAALGEDWKKVQPIFEFHISNMRELAELLEKNAKNIDSALYQYLLQARERDMKLAFLGLQVIADEMLRRAVNAAVNAFAEAVSSSLGLPKVVIV